MVLLRQILFNLVVAVIAEAILVRISAEQVPSLQCLLLGTWHWSLSLISGNDQVWKTPRLVLTINTTDPKVISPPPSDPPPPDIPINTLPPLPPLTMSPLQIPLLLTPPLTLSTSAPSPNNVPPSGPPPPDITPLNTFYFSSLP